MNKPFDPARLAINNTSMSDLKCELAALWAQYDVLAAYDFLNGGYSYERHALMDRIAPRVEAYEKAKRKERALEQTAEAYVRITSQGNESGFRQECVIAECERGEGEASSWGTSEQSAKRSLWLLSEVCDCGAVRHISSEDSDL